MFSLHENTWTQFVSQNLFRIIFFLNDNSDLSTCYIHMLLKKSRTNFNDVWLYYWIMPRTIFFGIFSKWNMFRIYHYSLTCILMCILKMKYVNHSTHIFEKLRSVTNGNQSLGSFYFENIKTLNKVRIRIFEHVIYGLFFSATSLITIISFTRRYMTDCFM